ncbi:MAG: DUF2191 domain-containing protein [Terriglobia bacterium]
MRTTITLDDDVALKLRAEARRSGQPFKAMVNHFLRVGLHKHRPPVTARPFRIRVQPLGLRPGLNYDNIAELIEHLEGQLHR